MDFSLQLQSQKKVCYVNRQCDINATSKVSSSRSCAYQKMYACGFMSVVNDAGDLGGSGINRVVEESYVNKYCHVWWNGSDWYVVFGRIYYAYDNAGNKSQPLYLWELMNDIYTENLTKYFQYQNGTWELKPGMSCPTEHPLL